MKARLVSGEITVGVFSAASPISATTPLRYDRGKAYLESRGAKSCGRLPRSLPGGCHTHPMLTMPIGCKVELDATNKRVGGAAGIKSCHAIANPSS